MQYGIPENCRNLKNGKFALSTEKRIKSRKDHQNKPKGFSTNVKYFA
jgi:hypothetical protein